MVKPRTILRCPWLGHYKFYLSWIFSYLILSVSKTSSRGQHFGTQIFFSPKQLSPFISSLWLSRITFSHTKATGPFNDWPFEELSVSRYCSTHWYGFPKNYSGLQKWLTLKKWISLFLELELNRTGHMSFLIGQDRTPKFVGQVLPDRTKSRLNPDLYF